MLHRVGTFLLCLLVASGALHELRAQATGTDQHSVTIRVRQINVLSVGNEVTVAMNEAQAGQDANTQTASSTVSVTTNSTSPQKISAALDADYSDGMVLRAKLDAPDSGASIGFQTLSAQETDLVTGVTATAASNLRLTYEASVSPQVEPNSYPRRVTYTILEE
jgi:hypothetical protein